MASHLPIRNCCFRLLLICILSALVHTSRATVFWAIDCGGNESFTSRTNTTWEAEGRFVHGGVNRIVTNVSDGIYSTLRAFEADRPAKGCYTFPVSRGTKVLAGARFYYGNYDGKGKPPRFLLQFDANPWKVIQTTMADEELTEVIYVTERDNTSICVARGTTGDTPFISALTLAVLEGNMYDPATSTQALFLMNRVAFGASEIVRDGYGRMWSDVTLSMNISNYARLNNTATKFNATGLANNPPPRLFQTAVAAVSSSSNISLVTPYLDSTPQPIYFNMYFTDPTDPTGSSNFGHRSFYISLNGQIIFNDKEPVVPPYGKAELYTSAVQMGSNSTVFDLVPTANATQPPVISAWELFVINGQLNNGTDSRDVQGLQSLQNQFKTLQDWAGDPCLPNNYSWEWVTCSSDSDSSPRIIQLDLKGYGLSGELPDFSSLTALQSIDLSNNNLTGDVPAFLAEMPDLTKLNLSRNDFTSIPSALTQKSNIELDVSGNPKLHCTGRACSPAASPEAQ